MESKYNLVQIGGRSPEFFKKAPTKRKMEKFHYKNDEASKKNIFKSNSDHNANPQKPLNKFQSERCKLPIFICRENLIKEVERSDTVLLMGETGSGKTTQIPQYLMDAGYGTYHVIGVAQPRRVAAITLAKRVSQEVGCNIGGIVGYKVRFEDCTSSRTRICFLTDGMLLREALGDRLLRNYSVIMIDEAHERTISTDVLFGIVKDAQRQRHISKFKPLKLVIASATMDIDHFGKYFNTRGLYLEGRNHPVRIFHAKEPQSDYFHAVLVTFFDIHRNNPPSYDVLIFLTGQEEIEAMAHRIRHIVKFNSTSMPGVRVFPLYAQLPQYKQMECFVSVQSTTRKVILATNIAETSITIPGIRIVIDCGFVKQKIHCPNNGLDFLRIVRISQAQALQRSGRAGRETSGLCYRTYTVKELSSCDPMPTPEILRSNITAVVLQLLALDIDCRKFDLIDKPLPNVLTNALKTLEALGAITPNQQRPTLTDLGRKMVLFPLIPQHSKMLLMASEIGCMEEMLSLVSMLSSGNVYVTSNEKQELASLAHAKFHSKHGDHLTLLNVYSEFQQAQKVKMWCLDNFLNQRNLFYAREVRSQLVDIAKRLNLPINSCGGDYDQVRKCLLCGLYENIAQLQGDGTYVTLSGGQTARIHPSSIFCGKYKPDIVVFSEILQTERAFLRQLTEIDVKWIAEIVPNAPYANKIKYEGINKFKQ